MPIYDFQCKDCEAVFEVFAASPEQGPQRCGYRCSIEAGENDELRGMGKLTHQIAFKGGSVRPSVRRAPTMSEAAKAGFQFYENKGNGVLSKVAGNKGPQTLRVNKDKT